MGTSLVVIIPEGVETLYSANSISRQKELSARSASAVNWGHPAIPSVVSNETPGNSDRLPHASSGLPIPQSSTDDSITVHVSRENLQRRKESSSEDDKDQDQDHGHGHDNDHEGSSPHAWIGIALVSGFILMYLIDKLPEFVGSSKQQRPPHHISLDNLGSGLRRNSSPSREGGLLDAGNIPRSGHSFATTTGLVIHAAADGIALGASSSDAGLSFIIFLAIMVHKAPASFGLTSVLLKQGLSSRATRAHLLVFSLAAPVGALMTFLFVQVMGSGSSGDETGTRWRTGVLLLFSAGTFL